MDENGFYKTRSRRDSRRGVMLQRGGGGDKTWTAEHGPANGRNCFFMLPDGALATLQSFRSCYLGPGPSDNLLWNVEAQYVE